MNLDGSTMADRMNTKFVLVFGTGRCGTAMLAQYFGGVADRQAWRRTGDALVAHEPFDKMQAYWQAVAAAKRGELTELVDRIVTPAIQSRRGASVCLLTDNKLGRWFFRDFSQRYFSKIIYLHRDVADVLVSLKRRSPELTDLHWCFEATDPDCEPGNSDAYQFHVDETVKRWQKLRATLSIDLFLEVSLERFIDDRSQRERVEHFVGIPGREEFVHRKTNAAATNFQP